MLCGAQTPVAKQALQAGPFPPGPHWTGHLAVAHWLLMSRLIALAGDMAVMQAHEQDGAAPWAPHAYSQAAV